MSVGRIALGIRRRGKGKLKRDNEEVEDISGGTGQRMREEKQEAKDFQETLSF